MNAVAKELARPAGSEAEGAHGAEAARVRVGTALSLLELAAQVLEELPPPEVALRLADRELYRYLQAAETACGWIVGHGAEATAEEPESDSALGDGRRIYGWSPEELERHYRAAMADFRDEQAEEPGS